VSDIILAFVVGLALTSMCDGIKALTCSTVMPGARSAKNVFRGLFVFDVVIRQLKGTIIANMQMMAAASNVTDFLVFTSGSAPGKDRR
jgi:hypothetical protein